MRKVIRQLLPNAKYHGVRSRESIMDLGYIGANVPHDDDLIFDTYDEFYHEYLPNLHLEKVAFLLFDSAYYITQA